MKFDFLNGINGEQSSKRLFTLILIVLFVTYFFSNLYWGFELKQTLEDNLFYLIMIFFAGVFLEGWKEVFAKKQSGTKTVQTTETTKTE